MTKITEKILSPDRRVMVVDDDPMILKLIERIFAPLAIKVQTFTDPYKALEAFKLQPVPVVLTDLDMPGMHGLELLKKMLSFNSSSRIIVITGYGDSEEEEKAFSSGASEFMEKPLQMAVLRKMVEKFLLAYHSENQQ